MFHLAFLFLFIDWSSGCAALGNCRGHGTCSLDDSFCVCDPGFDGDSCSLYPPSLLPALIAPGFVELGKSKHYRIEPGLFFRGDQVIVTPNSGKVNLYTVVGEIPIPGGQGISVGQEKPSGDVVVTINSLSPANVSLTDLSLYVTVQAVQGNENGAALFDVYFTSARQEGGILPMFPDWVTFSLIGALSFLFCVLGCCALFTCIMVSREPMTDSEREERRRKRRGEDDSSSSSSSSDDDEEGMTNPQQMMMMGGGFGGAEMGGMMQDPSIAMTPLGYNDTSYAEQQYAYANGYNGGQAQF